MSLARFIANLKFIPEGRRLELYPAFAMMRVKVLEIGDGWRRVRIRLPLNSVSRNPGGVMGRARKTEPRRLSARRQSSSLGHTRPPVIETGVLRALA